MYRNEISVFKQLSAALCATLRPEASGFASRYAERIRDGLLLVTNLKLREYFLIS